MTSSQPPAIPAIRHHRRSVDRVLPPALEVRLARLSIDEGESKSAHIIRAPPSLPLRMGITNLDREYLQTSSQDSLPSNSSSSSVNSSGLESIIEDSSSSYADKNNRLSKLGTSPDKGTTGHRRHHHHHHHHHHQQQQYHRSKSMLNPQAPSALFQIDQQHQQHYHQPSISVQYHRRSRSGSQLLGDSRGTNRTSDSGGGCDSVFRSLSFPQKTGGMHTDSPMMISAAEFGEDLFHWDSLELDNGFVDSPLTTIEKTATVLGPRPLRHAGIYKCDGNTNESDTGLQETCHTPINLLSPRIRRGGPLSAASSPVSARSRSQSPLQDLSENTMKMRDQSLESSQTNKAQQSGSQIDATDSIGEYLDVPDMEEDRLPPGSPMSIGAMSNDQDRWKSPTLSALASRSSSRGPSPRPLSPSPLSQRSALVMAIPIHHGHSSMDKGHISESTAVEDMSVEMPLIETRDEIPLQDIWRMEDEERKDRLNGVEMTTVNGDSDGEAMGGGSIEEHTAHMKGEQHAHEEARLIKEVIDAHSRAL